jgi:hypothetical protein
MRQVPSLLIAVALAVVGCGILGQPTASSAFVLTDPIDGGPVPVTCAGVEVGTCQVAAGATLDGLPPDAAGVEAVRVEPLADPPAGGVFAVRVTLDHKMFLNSGLQPYQVVQAVEGGPLSIAIILD